MWKVGQNSRSKKENNYFFRRKLSKLHKKGTILHVRITFSPKQGQTRTGSGPIWVPLNWGGGGLTSDQLFVILVEIFVVPLNKWENALCSVWFCHFTPWTWLLKFAHFAHYSALQYVVQGNHWIFWFNKEPFWLFKFPWTISDGSIKNSFFKPLKKVLKI